MYAIIESGGRQFKVRRDASIRVPVLPGDVGTRVIFDRVLCLDAGEGLEMGRPLLEGAQVVGEITRHGRGPKIVVFKFKRRHRYRRKLGHRQDYTEVLITALAPAQAGRPRRGGALEASGVDAPRSEPVSSAAGPHVCSECGRGFATDRGLQQHRSKAHGG
jgi:large subunit ribosomal protein L21